MSFIDTDWATGENMRVLAHGFHLIMMTDREIAVYDPDSKEVLQLFNDIPDPSTGRFTALGGMKGNVVAAYNPNPKNKKKSLTKLFVLKEISYERQICHLIENSQIKNAYRLFNMELRDSRN